MAIVLPLLYIAIIVLIAALLAPSGLWGNVLNLVNVVTAALLATNFFEPVSSWLTRKMPSFMFIADIFVLWILFAIFTAAMRALTELVSKYKLRFPPLVERVGNYAVGAWVGWVFVCFLSMSLITAPLGREQFGGGYIPEQSSFFGIYPDRLWLGFVQRMSMGTFSRATENVFDPRGELPFRYAERRAQFERQAGVLAKPQ